MAITNAQQYKQLVNPPMKGKKRPGYRGVGGYRGGPGGSAGVGREQAGSKGSGFDRGQNVGRDRNEAPVERNTGLERERQRNIERQKIAEKIQRPTTTFQKIKRSPFFQAASFITNPLSFGLQKIMDVRRAKRINELFGVDDDLG